MQHQINKYQNIKIKIKMKKKHKQNQNNNKKPQDLFIVVIHHYLLYKSKVFTFLILTKHRRL